MILYIFWLCALAWSTIKCEPPVNSYLPPSGSTSGRPSSQYGSPGSAGGDPSRGSRPGGSSGLQNQIQDNYLPPGHTGQSTLDTQYGAPSTRGFGQGSGQRGFESKSQDSNQGHGKNAPNSQYGTPSQTNGPLSRLTNGQSSFGGGSSTQSGSSGFGSISPGSSQRLDSSYGPPPTGNFQSSNTGFSSSGQPTNRHSGSNGLSSPLTDRTQGFSNGESTAAYSTPDFGGSAGGRDNDDRGSNFNGGDSNEPAKYQFSYDVDDPQTGTKYGHSEQRDGDLATGEYNVVLPDGRKQVVEYEAGPQGYKPQIRYEDTKGGAGGSNFGSAGIGGAVEDGSQGYSQSGPGVRGFSDGDNGVSAHGQASQSGTPARYQDANTFAQAESPSSSDNNGYPSGKPANGRPGLESSRFRTGPGQGGAGQNGRLDSNNIENLNSGSQGYPRGGAQGNNGGFSNSGLQAGGGYHSSNERGNGRGSQSIGRGGNGVEDGYPSGGPSGPRGSGY